MHPELRKWVYKRHTHTEREAHRQKEHIKIMDCQNEGPFNPPGLETPSYYKGGIFQIWDLTRYMSGDMAQAFQYVYRAGVKGNEADDVRKAIDFIKDWVGHTDVKRSILPDGVEPTDGPSIGSSLLLSLPESGRWKVRPLMEIVSADSYEGETVSGIPFCGRRLVEYSTIPLLQERLKALSG